MADRSRRERKNKLDKLAELKRAREGGGRNYKVGQPLRVSDMALTLYQLEDDATIYDEVTEEQYKTIVRGRLAKDDFVIDDGIGGYMDNGMDDFEEQEEYADSDEDRKKSKGAWLL